HQNLKQHMSTGEPACENTVMQFAKGRHPQFAILRDQGKDPGKLKFNHKLHMTPGLVLTEGGKPWTLAEIRNAADREPYRQPGQARPLTGKERTAEEK